ncbi:MAG: DUF1284 domain-containing protein [Actinobacteria bacterium]|nr:DUF1284 domain-containing protein [Actinomycetota bacterium]
MSPDKRAETVRLRPHHIFCSRFLPLGDLGRGAAFGAAMERVRRLAEKEGETLVEVTEGPDQLCVHCTEYGDGRCQSPLGDEEKVRRWDARILEGLGISYGESLRVKDLAELIREKAPLEFCLTRCPWRAFCGVSGAG